MDTLFAPPSEEWNRVSPRLRVMRRTILLIVIGIVLAAAILVLGVLLDWWLPMAAAIIGALGVLGWGWWLIGRNWQSWGYAERGDDLLVTHGVMFKTLVVVPYGRMQFVDVAAGPVDQRFGIATIELHTATPATDAVIPGLLPAEAEQLRDRLAALGEARAAGL